MLRSTEIVMLTSMGTAEDNVEKLVRMTKGLETSNIQKLKVAGRNFIFNLPQITFFIDMEQSGYSNRVDWQLTWRC